jgi:hypothetical protein
MQKCMSLTDAGASPAYQVSRHIKQKRQLDNVSSEPAHQAEKTIGQRQPKF